MTSATTAVARRVFAEFRRNIQVSGRTDFPESRWREAILFYLFGVWGNRDNVTYRPKIHFGDITLRLNRQSGEYYAYGHAEAPEPSPSLRDSDELVSVSSGKQEEVEVALIRFVKNNRIKQLHLHFPELRGGFLVLWKKDKRSEYGVEGIGLPYSWSTKGPIWTLEEYRTGDWWK
jgi:hypothetical protein